MFFQSKSILVRPLLARLAVATMALGGLGACGQKGPLFLPTGAEATGRVSLPQVLLPGTPTSTSPASSTTPSQAAPAATLPNTGASAPVRSTP
jgi:predicted small lipoprotein YifL